MSRFRLTIGALAVSTALVLFGAASATSAPVVGTDVLYTLDADFDQGTLVNVNHDAPNSNQLQLNTTSGTFPFIWIALSRRCTIAKINTETGVILGEYRTISDGQGCNESSRTTVSIDGSVWVGHRGPGGITHVGLVELNQCLDRNGNGTIETSGAYGDVKPWPGATGAVASAEDECILHHLNSDATGLNFPGFADTRHMSIDADNKLWVGSFNSGGAFARVNGTTGAIEVPPLDRLCGGYGGLIDGNGIIWSAQGPLLRWDPDAPDSPSNPTCRTIGHSVYGVAIDSAGSIWTTALSGNSVRKTSSDGSSTVGSFGHGSPNAQGLAVDGDGDVWVSSSLFCGAGCTIGHLKNDGTFVGNVPTPTGAGSTGIAVDAAGKIWAANLNSNTATRIDPDAGPLGCGGTGCADGTTHVGAVDLTVSFPATPGRPLPFPYNYSDMTGAQLFNNTAPQGSWTVVQDGGDPGSEWGTVTWNTEPQGSVPAGTEITVEARAADTEAGLGAQAYVVVSNGVEFTLTGRFIQVRATLQANDDGVSPILSDIRIEGGAEADISIDKTAPAQVTEDDVFSFSLAVKNNGPDDATNVTASDTLPAGVTYVSASASQGSCSQFAGTVSCGLGDLAAGATATVTVTVQASGPGPYVNNASAAAEEDDPNPANNHDTTTTNLNHNPICTATAGGPLWPPNHRLESFTLAGATDPDGNPVSITITGVTQDEPVDAAGNGDGDTSPDAFIVAANTVELRAERAGGGDGRVYHIAYTASDGQGGVCSGSTTVGVGHDQGGGPVAVDSAPPFYNSLLP